MASDAAATEIIGPFTEMIRFATDTWGPLASNLPRDLKWPALLVLLVIATCIYIYRDGHGSKGVDGRERKVGWFEFILPKDIYSHVSARVDIWLYALERVLRPLWWGTAVVFVAPGTERFMIAAMESMFGATPALSSNIAWMLLYSLVTLLIYDFIFYLTHFTMHKVPALWAIHKVHHSAEVLTPLTRSREHFIAGPIWATGYGFSFGFAAGVFAYLFDGNIEMATLFNISFFAVLFGFNGMFRHYHVQFHYPRWLSKWLQSPAMHHTHHSYLQKHWDTNMAAITSIYDRMFGTMYIPEKDEYTPWGIGPATQAEYRSFWQNTTGPFRDWYKMLTKGRSPQAGAVSSPRDLIPSEVPKN